jgi:hypothetical protein
MGYNPKNVVYNFSVHVYDGNNLCPVYVAIDEDDGEARLRRVCIGRYIYNNSEKRDHTYTVSHSLRKRIWRDRYC